MDISVKQGNGIIPFKGNVIFLKHANLSYTKRKRFKQKMSVLYVYVIYTFNTLWILCNNNNLMLCRIYRLGYLRMNTNNLQIQYLVEMLQIILRRFISVVSLIMIEISMWREKAWQNNSFLWNFCDISV